MDILNDFKRLGLPDQVVSVATGLFLGDKIILSVVNDTQLDWFNYAPILKD